MTPNTDTIVWRKGAFDTRTHVADVPGFGRVVIRATGQRNGRVLGGAWRATAGGYPGTKVASSGTLAGCKAAVAAEAARVAS